MLNSLQTGLARMWANKRMVLVFYLASFFFGLLMLMPMRSIMNSFIGNSFLGAELGGRLDMDFLFEFIKNKSEAAQAFGGLMLIVPAAYWLFSLFLSGGAFAVFAGEKYTPTFFWGMSAKYFGRFFRLSLWSLPVLGIMLLLQFLETGVQRLFFGSDPYQYITYWGGWIKFALVQIGILLYSMVLDYARIHAVLTDERKMRRSLWRGLMFAFGHFGKTFGLALSFFVIGAIVLAIYNPLANSLTAANTLVVLVLFLLQQVYMFFRMMLRLGLFASELQLYRGLEQPADDEEISEVEDLGIEGAPA